jgi:hypothetical protein
MSSVIQKATQHFRSKLDGSLAKIDVPEWESEIYFYPTTPLKEESSILKLQQEGKTVEALIQSIIVKARNADGSKMFAPADRVTMMNEVDPQILMRIAGQLNGIDVDSLDDIEKN